MKTYLVTFMGMDGVVEGDATVIARGEASAISKAKKMSGVKYFAYTHVMTYYPT
jgi:hypothetical protein